jgi:hypothetical protein
VCRYGASPPPLQNVAETPEFTSRVTPIISLHPHDLQSPKTSVLSRVSISRDVCCVAACTWLQCRGGLLHANIYKTKRTFAALYSVEPFTSWSAADSVPVHYRTANTEVTAGCCVVTCLSLVYIDRSRRGRFNVTEPRTLRTGSS